MRPMALLLLLASAVAAQAETADEIMAKVALNQDRAQKERAHYVYEQAVLVRAKRANGKLAREEYAEYTVTPTAEGLRKERTVFRGKYQANGKEIAFEKPGYEYKKVDVDASLVHELGEELTNDQKSRDGIARDLFPLTSAEQHKYDFQLTGEEVYRDQPVYRIRFTPKKGEEDTCWTGDALIHRTAYQPVLVSTWLGMKIPFVVRTALGIDLQHVGFKVAYERLEDGLWFPANYGGEMKLKLFFLYSRSIGISLRNSNFRRANVTAEIRYELPAEQE